MDYFCQQCAAKPAWEFDPAKAFRHSCQRCFQFLPCNDYAYKKAKVNVAPAPQPKEIVSTQVNSQAEVRLPQAKVVPPTPVPVYEVDRPVEEVVPLAQAPVSNEAPCAPPVLPGKPDNRNDTDKALDAVQPNRPGIKAVVVDKNGRPVPAAKQPKFEVAEDAKKQ